MMKIYLSFLILVLLTVGSVNTRAVEVGSNVKIGASATSAIDPQIVYCSVEDTFLLAWTNDSAGYSQIYYNLVAKGDLGSTGVRLSAPYSTGFLFAEKPQLAYDSSTGIAGVVYTESFAYHKDRIMLSFVDVSTGIKTGSFDVGTANSWNMSATVATDNNGTFLVAYFDTIGNNISAKFFNSAGVQQGATKVIGTIPSGYLLPYSIDIAYNSTDDNFLVVWADFAQTLKSITIDKTGTIGTVVNYASFSNVANPAVAYNPVNNEFFVTFDNYAGVVKGQLLDNVGGLMATTFTFGNAKLESNPDVFYNNAKDAFAITWQQYLDSAGIWMQEYKSHDCPFLYDSVKINNVSLTANAPVIAFDETTENYWTVWYGDSGGKDEIYLQKYESDVYLVNAICQDVMVYLNAEGKAVITVNDIDGGSTVICGSPVLTASRDTLTCSDAPSVAVDLIVTDNLGRKDTCTATVTVQDTISPTAVCQNITVYLDGTGVASITAADIDNGSSDNCGLGTLTASLTDFDCTDVGDVTVTLTVPDVNGNTKTCTSTVTVADTISPTAICQNITVYLDGTGAASITAADINNGSTDNCQLGTITASQTDFDCTDVGDVTVTLTVPDVNGNSKTCTSTVTVADTISPTAICQNITVYLDGTGAASITAADINNGSTDNCQLGTITASQTDFDCTDVGDVTVTLTVPDINGNSKTCTSTVTVADTISPTAVCRNITVYLDGTGAASITAADIDNGSTDNCTLGTITASQTDFDCTDVGDVTVTLTVPDVNGNSKTCTSTVTVTDTISPAAVCKNITVYLDGTGAASITAADIDNGSSDNCALGTITASQTNFDCTYVGDVTVTLTVPDVNGNSKTCTSTVTVTDTISPTAVCRNITVYLDGTGAASITAADIDNGSSDNCALGTLTTSQTDFGCTDVGDVTVTLTVPDVNGNTKTCTSTVTVADTISPTAVCQNITVYLDGTGAASITAADIDNGSSDNCALGTITASQTNFDCTYVGDVTVTLTVPDVNGNSKTCTSTVTVTDTISPTAVCRNITVYLDGTGAASITAADIDNGSSDNCGLGTITASQTDFDCTDVGDVTVTLTVPDVNGNTKNCTSTVTVADTIAPVVICQNVVVIIDSSGTATVSASEVDNGSTDNCEIDTLILSQTIFNDQQVGENIVTLTVFDASGNSSTCESKITVEPNVPKMVCNPIQIYLDEDGTYQLTKIDIDLLAAGTTDATTPYEDLIIEVYPDKFTCANIQWPVFTRVTAYNKFHLYSRCWAPVTVIDTFVFNADPIDDIEVIITDGACETKIEYPELTVASACATFTQVAGLGSNGMFPIGTTNEKWILTNAGGDTTEVSFKVTVVAANDLPAINPVSDVKINQSVDTVQIPLTGISYGNDCQVQSLTVTATGVNAALISTLGVNYVSPDATGSLTAMLVPGASGTDTITVKVADSGGDFVTDTFVIVVNAPPTINPVADVEADEDTPVVTVSLSGISSGSVTEMQTISVNAVHANAALVAGVNVNYTSPDATGSLDIVIHPNKFGTDTISIVVSDGEASVTETFVLRVNHVNHSPVVVNPLADQVVNASYVLKVPVNSPALPVFDDVDGDLLLFSILVNGKPELPAWMSVVNDTLILSPAIADTGCVEIGLMASDPSGEMAMDTFQLCVDGYPTGITDNIASVFDVQMFPNPSKGEVNLAIRSSVVDDSEVIVRSITGSEVFRKSYKTAENIKIDLSEQVSGIYLVTLKMGSQSVVKKLILDRK